MTENRKWKEKSKQRKIKKILRMKRIKVPIHPTSGAHLRKENHLNLQPVLQKHEGGRGIWDTKLG